jgi:hypothetical protein
MLARMMGKYACLALLIASVCLRAVSQDYEGIDWSERLIEEVKLENPVYKPVISLGTGFFQFHGDLRNPYNRDITLGLQGLNVDIYRALTPEFKFGFRFMYGELTGNHFDLPPLKNLNFKTQMMSYGIGLTYNFGHIPALKRNEERVLSPFVTLGIEFLNYDVYADHKTRSGTDYHYWSDGTIRDMPQSAGNYSSSRVLQRDYDFETSLNKENIDKLDDPSPVTFGIPVDFGFDFIMSQKVQFRLGYSYHFTFNDLADNISTVGNNYDKYPERMGNKANDRFSYTYVSFTLDLFSKTTEDRQLQFLDLGSGGIFDFWDMDGDFVMDIYDQCPWTPFRVPVDSVGCPFDTDGDGVPDYKDLEPNTPADAFFVDINGVSISEDAKLRKLNNSPAMPQADIYKHYPSLLDGTGLARRFYKDIPPKFASFDTDGDAYISLEELMLAMNKFFDGSTELTVDDLYELNEFFFIQ